MREVARAAGVHQTTVSLALRNHASIPPATRERIKAVAAELGYKPNPLVAALMNLRHRTPNETSGLTTIAYISSFVPDLRVRTVPYFQDLLEGATSRAASLGYRIEQFVLGQQDLTEAQLNLILITRNIRAALISPPLRSIKLDWDHIIAVGIGPGIREPLLDRVSNDHFLSAATAFRTCRELGLKRIGFAMAQRTSERLDHRYLSGFLVQRSLIPAPDRVEPLLFEAPDLKPPPRDELVGWIRREKPEAVLCYHYLARSVQSTAKTTDEKSPIMPVVLDLPNRNGPLSGMYDNPMRIGAIGAELLIGKLQRNEFGRATSQGLQLVPGEWVAGGRPACASP